LDRTLQSMVTVSLHMENPDYNQISFIYRYVYIPLIDLF
jgi:hypothetical protein